VSVDQLAKRLRREVLADPKKAAILGLMLLVALWFWAPLVMGWIGKKESGPTAKPADAGPATMAGFLNQMGPGTPTAPQAKAETPWHVLAQWMDRDPLKQAVRPAAGQRDPFRMSLEVVKQKEQPKPEKIKKTVAPEALGLSLTGTVVGPGRRVALINGKSYRQGEDVKLAREGQTQVFKLAEVRADRVVLEQSGRTFEIKMRVRAGSSHIELMGKNE